MIHNMLEAAQKMLPKSLDPNEASNQPATFFLRSDWVDNLLNENHTAHNKQ